MDFKKENAKRTTLSEYKGLLDGVNVGYFILEDCSFFKNDSKYEICVSTTHDTGRIFELVITSSIKSIFLYNCRWKERDLKFNMINGSCELDKEDMKKLFTRLGIEIRE